MKFLKFTGVKGPVGPIMQAGPTHYILPDAVTMVTPDIVSGKTVICQAGAVTGVIVLETVEQAVKMIEDALNEGVSDP